MNRWEDNDIVYSAISKSYSKITWDISERTKMRILVRHIFLRKFNTPIRNTIVGLQDLVENKLYLQAYASKDSED